jgi:hypothetical protein
VAPVSEEQLRKAWPLQKSYLGDRAGGALRRSVKHQKIDCTCHGGCLRQWDRSGGNGVERLCWETGGLACGERALGLLFQLAREALYVAS